MRTKGVVLDDFVNYKKPSMFISTCFCNWKCCIGQNLDISVCQNSSLAKSPVREFTNKELIDIYKQSIFHKAVLFGGLEPFEQFAEVYSFVVEFRDFSEDDIVIYTGFNKDEIEPCIEKLRQFKNIIIKYGRYIPNDKSHIDNVLGIKLASQNQYAEKIS